MALIDNGVYVAGRRVETPASLDETYELMRKHGGLAWIGLYRPSEHELESVAAEFDLHPLAVEDALTGHQRSKVERYGDTLFVVLRPAHYRDVEESVEFGELHVRRPRLRDDHPPRGVRRPGRCPPTHGT